MTVTFIYKDKSYTTNELDRKLAKMNITMDDIKICKKIDCAIGAPDPDRVLYRFYNEKTGETIVSIYDNLDRLRNIVNI